MWLYPEVRTLGDFISYHSRHSPARPALLQAGRVVSFGEYDLISNQFANGLLADVIQHGARIGFLGLNSLDFYFALTGTSKTRAAFTVFNWRLSAAEIAALIQDSAPQRVFVERRFLALWEAALDCAQMTVETIVFDEHDTIEARYRHLPASRPSVWISEEDTAIQIYTSGTTGKPKGVMLTHGGFNRMRLCEHLEPAFDWRDDDIFINPLPNFHLLCIGIAFQCLYNGVAIAVVRQFDPALVLKTIDSERPTILTLTPTMLQMLLDHPDSNTTSFASLRLTLYSGSPVSLGLIKRAMGMMPGKFMQFYGATEANGAFSLLRPDEHRLDDEAKLQSCGRPLPLVEFRIVGQNGIEVASGDVGELLVRSPAIFAGYWKQPEVSRAALSNGWYRSGDMARRDSDGLYYIVDRAKDMIVSGGENIYSAEIENVLSVHPKVSAVAVIGVPDPRWGEAVKAVIVLRPDVAIDSVELLSWCRDRLAGYKIPKSIDFVDSLPTISSGKVSKKDLRARYWVGQSRSVA